MKLWWMGGRDFLCRQMRLGNLLNVRANFLNLESCIRNVLSLGKIMSERILVRPQSWLELSNVTTRF